MAFAVCLSSTTPPTRMLIFDGVNVQPVTADSIQIFAGQRYSFVLTADQPISNYWVRAKPNIGNTEFTNGLNSAILRYAGADDTVPTTTLSNSSLLLETALHPLRNRGAPGRHYAGGADVEINVAIGFAEGKFTINGASFVPPTAPVLLQILSGARTAQELLPAENVYVLPPNKVIEVTIPGGAVGSPHPFHLHGHNFDVIRSAGSSVYNYHNPVRRDVVSTGVEGDNVTIRFTTDNPGPWLLHCHIDWHLDTGLAIVFAEDGEAVSYEKPPPRCRASAYCSLDKKDFGDRNKDALHLEKYEIQAMSFDVKMDVAFFRSFFGGNAKITPQEYDQTTAVVVAELNNPQAGAVFGVSKIKNGNRYSEYHLRSMMVVFHPSAGKASCWLSV
ncbi:Acyl-coenzyme A oxidase 2 [Asterophora parasitica]|uniref:laccase n=1 Tax=Asterophora parasitica TaxID=117018 RepID=A0A9P7KHL0_9AGAR|nr:Acyl-coenzyme A oxidase 2 [Asterophora parasitica]